MLLGVVIGSFLTLFVLSLLERHSNKKVQESLDSVFKEVLSNITNGSSKFISRVNNIVNIEMNLESQGSVNIMYWLNSKDVSIFKGENCIYTSNNVDQDIMKKISANILLNYNESINNTVIVLDTIFDKDTFSRLTGMDIDTAIIMDDIKPTQLPDPSLDEILDRINIVGYDNLSDFEKKLLKKYGSSK
jgi:hypothetical protein